jgi:hypothetical protein
MDEPKHSISPDALYARLGSDAASIIVDVRREADFASVETLAAQEMQRGASILRSELNERVRHDRG